ncbi:MAG TPA: SCO family protein [Gaiellaceae bacterium]|nr:SCO family protein [Gaiellaceae bacterium]
MPRLYVIAVCSATVVGIVLGVVIHNVFATPSARARPSLPTLYGQATWKSGAAHAPPVALRDQHGRRFSLASLRGRTVVLAFMDSLCKAECPLEAAQLAAAVKPLPSSSRPRLVIVSVDLADTPRSVAAAARRWHLPARFEWLLGTHAQLAPVWRAYGIEVDPTKSGDVAHSDAFYLIDANGDERAAFLSPFIPGLVTRDLSRLAS